MWIDPTTTVIRFDWATIRWKIKTEWCASSCQSSKGRCVRVLHVINSLSGSGGAENGLVREIMQFGADVVHEVVTLYDKDQLGESLGAVGISSHTLGLDPGSSGWNWLPGARRLEAHIQRYQPNVVHSSLASANLIAQIAGRRTSTPVVSTFTLSGDPLLMRRFQPGAASKRAQLLRRVEQASARQSHVWFRALTEDARATNTTAARLDLNRVRVIPRGVPLPDDSPATPSRRWMGLPEEGAVVLNVGRQTAQKGHGDLVEAFASIVRERPAHLVILGRMGDGSESLHRGIAAHGVEHHVTVIPYTDRIYDYYRAADVFAFPSFMEGLGTAVLEAMACRLPVVAYDIPPVREIAGGGRFASLVPVGDIGQLSRRIVEVIEGSSEAAESSALAYSNVVEHYTVERVASRLEEYLGEVAAVGVGATGR
jgi:glycosyltransferase involved in cell wall biosynthesis